MLCLVLLSWRKNTCCVLYPRFSPENAFGANAGLVVARDLLEPIKKQYPWISYGDLWTLGGVVAIEEMGGKMVDVFGSMLDVSSMLYKALALCCLGVQ